MGIGVFMKCNICENDKFIDMNKRKNVTCKNCGSLERTRLFWMYLQNLKIDRSSKILHIAPEKGLSETLSTLVDEGNYIAADMDPRRFAFAKNCQKINLCELDDHPCRQRSGAG